MIVDEKAEEEKKEEPTVINTNVEIKEENKEAAVEAPKPKS